MVRNNIKTTCELINVLHFLCYILIMNPFMTGHRALEKKQITQGNNRKVQNPSGSQPNQKVAEISDFFGFIAGWTKHSYLINIFCEPTRVSSSLIVRIYIPLPLTFMRKRPIPALMLCEAHFCPPIEKSSAFASLFVL